MYYLWPVGRCFCPSFPCDVFLGLFRVWTAFASICGFCHCFSPSFTCDVVFLRLLISEDQCIIQYYISFFDLLVTLTFSRTVLPRITVPFFSVFFSSLNSDSWPSLFVNCFCSSVPGHRILATSVVLFLSSRYVPIIGAPFVEKLFHVLSIHLLWLFITIYLLFQDDKLFVVFSLILSVLVCDGPDILGFGLWWPWHFS